MVLPEAWLHEEIDSMKLSQGRFLKDLEIMRETKTRGTEKPRGRVANGPESRGSRKPEAKHTRGQWAHTTMFFNEPGACVRTEHEWTSFLGLEVIFINPFKSASLVFGLMAPT